MAGPQEIQDNAVDNKMADPQNIEETDAGFELTDLNKSQEKDADLKMADPQTIEEDDTDVELEVLPQYQANDVDLERTDDNSVPHTEFCPDSPYCDCPRRPTRRDILVGIGYFLLILAAFALFCYGVVALATAARDAEAAHAQDENCTVVYSYATPMGVCVNETKLD